MSNCERVWNLSIDGQCQDEGPFWINHPDWVDYREFLDPLMVGLAIGTEHVDAKITVSRRLIEIHEEHLKIRKTKSQSNVAGLLPEKIMDRLVYGMIANCAEDTPTPNVLLHLLALRLKVPENPRKAIKNRPAYNALLHLVAEKPGIGKKKAAEAVGVSPNTAKRWMDDPEFKESLGRIQNLLRWGVI
jgi:hypothetical protein